MGSCLGMELSYQAPALVRCYACFEWLGCACLIPLSDTVIAVGPSATLAREYTSRMARLFLELSCSLGLGAP